MLIKSLYDIEYASIPKRHS